jgi:hypothetical protein
MIWSANRAARSFPKTSHNVRVDYFIEPLPQEMNRKLELWDVVKWPLSQPRSGVRI